MSQLDVIFFSQVSHRVVASAADGCALCAVAHVCTESDMNTSKCFEVQH
jgi:hypothetical protein